MTAKEMSDAQFFEYLLQFNGIDVEYIEFNRYLKPTIKYSKIDGADEIGFYVFPAKTIGTIEVEADQYISFKVAKGELTIETKVYCGEKFCNKRKTYQEEEIIFNANTKKYRIRNFTDNIVIVAYWKKSLQLPTATVLRNQLLLAVQKIKNALLAA